MALTRLSTGLFSADSASVNLNIDAGTLYIDATNNRVGIGNTSPTQKLDIDSGHIAVDAGYGLVWSGDADRIITPEDNSVGGLFKVASGAATRFMRGSNESMRIDASGNVGIGTSSPDNNKLVITDSSDVGIQITKSGVISSTVKSVTTGLAFGVDTSSGNTERMRIDSSGNVGIGTSSPAYKLNVAGDIVADGDGNTRTIGFDFYGALKYNLYMDGTADADKMHIRKGTTNVATFDTSGNVGIGTSSPNAYASVTTLTINGTNQGRLDVEYGGTHGGSFLALSGETQIKAVGASNVMTFEVNNAERMRIDTSGNVGIGTTSPVKPLHVVAGHSTTRAMLQYDPGTSNEAQMVLWASEPGVTFNGVGIGHNIHEDGHYYGRFSNNFTYGTYLRFYNGHTYFGTTTGSRGTIGGTGTTNMEIDPSGLVTTPNQSSARWYATSGPNVGNTATVVNNVNLTLYEQFDQNGDFNLTTGEFTAPVAGVYYVYAYSNFTAANSSGYMSLEYYNGSSWVRYAIAYKDNSDSWTPCTLSTTIDLSAGMKIRTMWAGDPDAGAEWFYGGYHLLG